MGILYNQGTRLCNTVKKCTACLQHLGIFTQIPGPKISDKITKKSPMGCKTRAAIARAKHLSKK